MENRKSRKSTFLYVILLTLCVPLAYVYLILVTGLLDKIQEGHIGLTLMIVFLPLFFYWGLVAVVGIINIGQSFKIYKTGNPIECVNRMLIHKYGLVVFFCVNFLVLFIYYFFISMAVLVGSRGAAIIFAPVLLPWLIVAVVFSVGATWLAILPGSFYGIQVIRMTYKSGKQLYIRYSSFSFCLMCWMQCILQRKNGEEGKRVLQLLGVCICLQFLQPYI